MSNLLKKSVKILVILGVLVFFLPGVQAEEKIFDVDEVDQKPSLVLKKAPDYPLHAKNSRLTGKVVLEFQISSDGTVSNVVVVTSEPEGVFDDAAVKAVSKWRFKPAMVGETPVHTKVKVPIKFEL